jgi:hypothetical protein
MVTRNSPDRRCTYVVSLEQSPENHELADLAGYLSRLGVAGCEVVILDASPASAFERHTRTLRWVGKHVRLKDGDRSPSGNLDLIRAGARYAGREMVIVARADVRYTAEAIEALCVLLDSHEVVEPQDYLDPLTWWGRIEAARMLLHRAVEPRPDHGATVAFRRSVILSLSTLGAGEVVEDMGRRLEGAGAEVAAATEVFVRRQPGNFEQWLERRPLAAEDDFAFPFKSAFFFALFPLLLVAGLLGEPRLAASYAGVVAFASVGLALRGRAGATAHFPLHTCLYAPFWLFERSVSVYWAMGRKLWRPRPEESGVPVTDSRADRAASGE